MFVINVKWFTEFKSKLTLLQPMAAAAAGMALITAVIGGGGIIQIGVNSSLATQIGHFLPASAVSFLGGTVLLLVVNGALYSRARRAGELQKGTTWEGFRLYEVCGGLIGTCTLIGARYPQ